MKQESRNLEKIISALALITIGVCLILWADKITKWFAIGLGVFALVVAAARAVKYFKAKPSQHTSGNLFSIVLVAVVGLLLVSRADFVKEAISFVVGVYIILSCSVQLVILSSLRRQSAATSRAFVWAIIGIIVGILCIIGKFIVPDALTTIAGIALVVYGVVYLLGLITIQKVIKTAKPKSSQKKIAEADIVKEAKEAEVVKPSPKTKK